MKIKIIRPKAELCGVCDKSSKGENIRYGWGSCCKDKMVEAINIWYLRKVELTNGPDRKIDSSF